MPKVPPKAGPKALKLRLYTAGQGANSLHALASLTAICEEHFPAAFELEIVDVLVVGLRALADGIIVTPTLLKLRPLPVQRIIGGLGDTAQVHRILAGK